MSRLYDLLIIGGGINGAGIARDAAGRGLNVLLCEKDDLAAHTSSASTKLIHGGLRYLEQYDFRLVRKALKEREVLLRAAPHIIWPLRFVLPHHKDLRPAWLIELGLFFYDYMGGRKLLPPSRTVTRAFDSVFDPLKPEFTRGFEYSDCWVDDARLVVLNAMDAEQRSATIMTRTECVALEPSRSGWKAALRLGTGVEMQVEAKVVINAAGPWVDQVAGLSSEVDEPNRVRLVKGSHIIVPRLFEDERCFIFQAGDGRVVFAIPYQDGQFTLIGTTDVPFDRDLNQVKASRKEVDYLCEQASAYFKREITIRDVIATYAGVRPLFEDHAAKASSVTRDYVLKLDTQVGARMLSVIGGKITTYRKLAEDALKLLKPDFPRMQGDWTRTAPLPGGEIPNADFAGFEQDCAERYDWLDSAVLHRLARTYGTRIHVILHGADHVSDLGPHYGGGLYQKEIDYLIGHEYARSCEDIIWRRTKLGLHLTPDQIEALRARFRARAAA